MEESFCHRNKKYGLQGYKADGNVYKKKSLRDGKVPYYEYMIVYVDDVICISDTPEHWIDALAKQYRLRETGIRKRFLGSDIKSKQYIDDNGHNKLCWAFRSETYVRDACSIAEDQMMKNGISYPSTRRHWSSSPYSSQSYRPELDSSEFCDSNLTTMFQNLIGVFRWIVELGRIDIQLETSLLSQYLAQPRIGHLEQA